MAASGRQFINQRRLPKSLPLKELMEELGCLAVTHLLTVFRVRKDGKKKMDALNPRRVAPAILGKASNCNPTTRWPLLFSFSFSP